MDYPYADFGLLDSTEPRQFESQLVPQTKGNLPEEFSGFQFVQFGAPGIGKSKRMRRGLKKFHVPKSIPFGLNAPTLLHC